MFFYMNCISVSPSVCLAVSVILYMFVTVDYFIFLKHKNLLHEVHYLFILSIYLSILKKSTTTNSRKIYNRSNQSVENAGVAFVKEANEKKKVLWENKQTVIYMTNKLKDEQSQGRTDLGMNSVR